MVENISKSRASVVVGISADSGNRELLALIEKKKKLPREGSDLLPSGTLPPQLQARLIHLPVSGGGFLESKAPTQHALAQDNGATELVLRGALRQQVLHAAAAITAQAKAPEAANDLVPTGIANARSESKQTPDLSDKAQAVMAEKTVFSAERKLSPSPILNRAEVPDLRLQPSGEKYQGTFAPLQNTAPAREKPASATLQQMKTQVSTAHEVGKADAGNQMLEVDYAFQRWSGDHSVKVSVPTQAQREGMITLLPSDTRTAHALFRQMGQLTGFTPDLLQPQQERDERQQKQQQQQHEEQE